MKGSKNGLRVLRGASGSPLNGPICSSCRHFLQRRAASTATATAPSQPEYGFTIRKHRIRIAQNTPLSPKVRAQSLHQRLKKSAAQSKTPTSPRPPPPVISNALKAPLANTKLSYQIRAGVLLSRPPLITRDLHPFESSFYLYQKRLNERLALRPMQYFYFRPDTPAMIDYQRKKRLRGGVAARDIGSYNPYANEGAWDDEVKMGSEDGRLADANEVARRLLEDARPLPKEGEVMPVLREGEQVELQARETEADKRGDQRSLERLLQRTLYFAVQSAKGEWTLPEDVIVGRESLQMAAERILHSTGGPNMNTWVVGNHPIGHRVLEYGATEEDGSIGRKSFFMRARIMAGQADLTDNAFGLKDFKWLAREELEELVERRYWNDIKNMIPAR